MNAIYICVTASPWIEAIEQLNTHHNFKPVHLVVWSRDLQKFKASSLKEAHFQTVEQAWKGLGFSDIGNPYILDETELNAISTFEVTALNMMDRLDPDGKTFSYHSRSYFFRELVQYWMTVIKSHDVNVVISPSIPHRVFDYALYVAAKLRNVRFIMFQMTSLGSRSILIGDIDKMPQLELKDRTAEISSDTAARIDRIQQDYTNAMPLVEKVNKEREKRHSHGLKLILHALKKSSKIFQSKPNVYWVQKGRSPQTSKYGWFSYFLVRVRRDHFVKELRRNYEKHVSVEKARARNYVFVPLHYQPEETTCPSGGAYSDQIRLIRLLSKALPSDMAIVIKEHRSQFLTFSESASGRSLKYYDVIRDISPRIQFAPAEADPFQLIDGALATITVTGTVGWESAVRGTPALIFGRAWYENMPGIYKVKSYHDICKALDKVAKEKKIDLSKDIIDFHLSVEQNAVLATHYKAFAINSDVSVSESVDNIVNALSNYREIK